MSVGIALALLSPLFAACASPAGLASTPRAPAGQAPTFAGGPTLLPAEQAARPEGTYVVKMSFFGGEPVDVAINYVIDLPPGYGADRANPHPLLIFLHGAGQNGNDIARIRQFQRPALLRDNPDEFPFILLYPQLPAGFMWPLIVEGLDRLLASVIETFTVDPGRVYLTGYSDGGFGVWSFATAHPERFAAIVPIAGYFAREASLREPICAALADMPAWVFASDADTIISVQASAYMVDILRGCGAPVKFTVFADLNHFEIPTFVFGQKALYEWLLEHSR